MSSGCISNCIVDDARTPVRATYRNLYKWPESDAEFMRSSMVVGSNVSRGRPMVVESISCRQLYLRSYTFSRKETMPERTKKCLVRVKEKVVARRRRKRRGFRRVRQCRCMLAAVRKVKAVSCAIISAVFQRLLSCTATVDVVHHE